MASFSDRFHKFMRRMQRVFLGESNRIETGTASAVGLMAIAEPVSIPNPNDRLEFEIAKVKVEGSRRDVQRVRCLDNVIGLLSCDFNRESAKEIDLHVADVADSLARIKAYSIGENGEKTPVTQLRYKTVIIPLGPKPE